MAISPYVTVVIVLVVIFALVTLYTRMMIKGHNREAAQNAQIAQQAGMRYIDRPTEQPTGIFDVYKRETKMATHFAIDPKTNDWSMQMYYNIPPGRIHVRGDTGEDHNVSVATVSCPFWVEYNIIIIPKNRIGRYKGRYLTGNEEFDKKWAVGSMKPEFIPGVLTPAAINALLHPPFELNKETQITFRGPQMTIETKLVEFAKRIELLRWMQKIPPMCDPQSAPLYGAFSTKPQQTSGNELPWTLYDWPEGDEAPLGEEFDPAQYEADESEAAGAQLPPPAP